MVKRTNKRAILKGIYEENLSVTEKLKAQKSGDDETDSAGSLPNRKLHIFALFGAALVIVATGLLVHWALPEEQLLTDFSQPDPNETSGDLQASSGESVESLNKDEPGKDAKIATLVPMDKDQSSKSELDSDSLQKTLQKKLVEVDNLEGLDQSTLEKEELDPANFEALAKSGVSLARLFGLGVKTIVIDPGHGGKDPGAVAKSKLYEKDVVLKIATKLRDKLVARGDYEVLMTRESDDTISLSDRVEFANANSADLFISIHINYSESKNSFIETYYFGATDDKKVQDLARLENADSHYEYGEFKEIIQKIGDKLKFQESRQLAHSVQTNLFGRMKQINKHTSDHGIKSAPFVVLLGLDTPSILTEVSCFCNPEEEKRLKSSKYQESIAAFLEKGIVSYLNNTRVGGKRNGKEEKLVKAQQ